MKTILFGALFIGIAAIIIPLKTSQTRLGPHGGKVKSAGKYAIETKISSEYIYAYLLDAKDNVTHNKGVSCQLKFLFFEKESVILHLKPYGTDGFITRSDLSGYQSYQVSFYLRNEFISTTFENENVNLIVKKQKHVDH